MESAEHWYALTAVLLFLKMFFLSVYQGYHRIGKRVYKTPEDAALMRCEVASEELPQVQRAARAWLNDLENIPIFLALAIAFIWLGGSSVMAAWLFMSFTLMRYLHTLFYLVGMQPWRTLAYAGGILCLFALSSEVVWLLF